MDSSFLGERRVYRPPLMEEEEEEGVEGLVVKDVVVGGCWWCCGRAVFVCLVSFTNSLFLPLSWRSI